MPSKPSKSAVDFFYKYAGYSHSPKESVEQGRRRGAVALATAEQYAADHDWTYKWRDDPDGWDTLGDIDPADVDSIGYVVLYDSNGKVLQSLGGVAFGRNTAQNQRDGRVFEAELALEAMLTRRR